MAAWVAIVMLLSACGSARGVRMVALAGMACTKAAMSPASPSYPAATSTVTRPQLSDAQAGRYTLEKVMEYATDTAGRLVSDPWDPMSDACMTGSIEGIADYLVDQAGIADGVRRFTTIQAAVSKAVSDAAATRIYIEVRPGVYNELVYVPADAAPITLFSRVSDAGKTRIVANIDAGMPGAEYAAKFGAQFAPAAPAVKAMYESVAAKRTVIIGTANSAVVWTRNDGFQLRNITLENGYNEDRGNCMGACTVNSKGQFSTGNHQAVAFLVDGADKVQVENVRFIGNQDTLYFRSSAIGKIARSFYRHTYIEGDVDFIFGRATAYFTKSEIKSLGVRSASLFALAPSTNLNTPYGIVIDDCDFTSDGLGVASGRGAYLARQWFESQRCSPYGGMECRINPDPATTVNDAANIGKNALEAVGKAVIRHSRIGAHINQAAPWAAWNGNPAAISYRPAQYSSNDFFDHLKKAGKDPERLGYARKSPAEPFLVEYRNLVK